MPLGKEDKKMKKVLSIILAAVMVLACMTVLAGCGSEETGAGTKGETTFAKVAKEDLKVGLITIHDDSSTYDKNFIDSMNKAFEQMGLDKSQLVLYTGIDESSACYDKAKACANQGCQVVFADSFGHEDFMIQAAQEFPEVRFAHATGTKAHTTGLPNYSNAFAAIYEGRYVAGVAAGMKINEMIADGKITADQAVMGYVGAFTYAEVMSGYSSFFLGARSVCPTVTMKVKFTGSWYDTDKEYAAASSLIKEGCVLISQHADSYGAPNACEEAGVPNVSYNGSTEAQGPNTYLTASKIDWAPYFVHMIQCVLDGVEIERDWTGTIATGSVQVLEASKNCAAGTKEAMDKAIEDFKAGKIKVYDVKTFTVTVSDKSNATATVDADGHLTSYIADVDDLGDYEKETEVIKDGYFAESEYRSAPYFDIEMDGITLLDRNYG